MEPAQLSEVLLDFLTRVVDGGISHVIPFFICNGRTKRHEIADVKANQLEYLKFIAVS